MTAAQSTDELKMISEARAPLFIPYPKRASEDIYGRYSLARGVASKHTRDLIVLWFAILLASGFVVYSILNATSDGTAAVGEVVAAVLAAFFAASGTVYQLGKRRFATVDLFSSEIMGRIRMSASDGFNRRIMNLYDLDEQSVQHYEGRSGAQPNISPSVEGAFELFFRHSADLGALSPPVVDYVTDCYNFHIGIRDEIRDLQMALSRPKIDVEEVNTHVINALFMIDIVSLSAFFALDLLIEKGVHRWHAWQLCCYTGVEANNFVRQVMPSDDPRFPEVVRRAKHYETAIKNLNDALRQNRKTLGLAKGEVFF